MSHKHKRKFQAIETMEQGITAYLTINSILEHFGDDDFPNMKVARFVAKATLNELLYTYIEKNSEQQLQAFIQRLNQEAASFEGGNADQDLPPAVPSV